ncbi:MAG: hypothetical protein J6U92_07755 [Clostridia bacterium]|nr:hypothetical protein [Clostridia bacterium]
MSKKSFIGPLIFVLALVVYAFSQGFWMGLNVLGDIVNIFGTVFVWLIKLIFSIPQVAEEIIKRVVTTLLILGLSTWWCVEDFVEQKIVNIIAKIIVAIIFAILSWIGMF